jgi:arylsulfatase A-like enzyme
MGRFFPLLLLLALAAGLAGCGGGSEEAPRNLVLISLDTLRADRLGCYGYDRDTSPTLDAFAGESVLFEYAVSQANETVRSHRSLFASKYPTRSLVLRDRPVLADWLRQEGFTTGGFTDGGPMAAEFGFDQGFDKYVDWGKGLKVKSAQALDWLDTLAPEQPFFLFIHCFDIHAPYSPPPPYDEMFTGQEGSTVVPSQTAQLLRRARGMGLAEGEEPARLTEADLKRVSDLYDGGIRYTDMLLDRLFSELDGRGLLGRSAVVVLSDHGEEFFDHGSVLHGHTLHQELTRVPLIIRAPGLSAGRVPGVVGLIDVVPTVFELLGLIPPDEAVGHSLLPLIEGERETRGGPPLLSEGMEIGHYAVIEDGFKLIRRPSLKRYQLFDIRADIPEQRDIAGMPRHKERVLRLKNVMERHHRRLMALPRGGPLRDPKRGGQQMEDRTVDRLKELGYLEADPPADKP